MVQPIGNPISHSTNRGLSILWNEEPCFVIGGSGWPQASFASCAPWSTSLGSNVLSFAFGVAHSLAAASVSVVPEGRPLSVEYPAAPDAFASPEVAVGHNPQSLPLVARTDVLSREQYRRHAVAQAFQVGNDVLEAKRHVAGDVLEEAERRRDLPDDSSDVGPEVSGILSALARSRKAEGLTGVASSDEIHSAAPRSAVEGREIVPDRSRIQGRFLHPGHEDGRCEGFPLDIAHGATPSGQSEVDAADSGAEGEGAKSGTCSHIV